MKQQPRRPWLGTAGGKVSALGTLLRWYHAGMEENPYKAPAEATDVPKPTRPFQLHNRLGCAIAVASFVALALAANMVFGPEHNRLIDAACVVLACAVGIGYMRLMSA